ncbi:MAG TPA: DUF475 domain-containing protein [Candidatus Saccharimonadales bacterium]|nr:DUF475 domain-containing protein [Candidatus Saccharimonadales bacterium]
MAKLGRLQYYVFSLTVTIGILIAVASTHPAKVVLTTAILAVLEVSFSFDNAVVNSVVLQRMSAWWQAVFMTVGIIIAVGLVRFVLPIVIVMATAHLGFSSVINQALHHPHLYKENLDAAHVQVAVIGGVFLLMIFLGFVFDDEREEQWIVPFERPLARLGKVTGLAAVITTVVILVIAASESWKSSVLYSGFGSLAVFLIMDWLGNKLENEDEEGDDDNVAVKTGAAGWAGLALFGYLEFQDAAFSFDGVSGAFAISSDVIIIAAGLCIGALFVRSMTVDLVHSGKLAELRYLEHGAHWAIGTLAAFILVSTHHEAPSYVTGLIGVVFIALAVVHSTILNRREGEAEPGQAFSDAVFGKEKINPAS